MAKKSVYPSNRRPTGQSLAAPAQNQVNSLNVVMEQAHIGPLPPPDMLARYDEIEPGLAKRIVERSEREQDHRHRMIERDQAMMEEQLRHDRDVDRAMIMFYRIGQGVAVLLTFALFGVGCYLVHVGHAWQAVTLIIGGISAIAVAYVFGARSPVTFSQLIRKSAEGTGEQAGSLETRRHDA